MLAGSVFHVANLVALGLLAAVAGLWWHRAGGKVRAVLLGLVLLLALNEFAIAPVIADLKAAGAVDRHVFARWHGLAALVHLAATLLATALVVCAESVRERGQHAGYH